MLKLDRRKLLRWMAQGAVVASAPGLACGDDGGGPGGSGGTGPITDDPTGVPGAGKPGDPVSDELRASALADVDAALAELVGSGTTFEPQRMIERLRGNAAFSRVGYTASSRCAWAVFTDGRKVIVSNNVSLDAPPPGPSGLRARVHRRVRGLSSDDVLVCAPQFRNVNMLRGLPLLDHPHVTQPWVDDDTLPRLSRVAAGLGYFDVDLGMTEGDPPHPLITDVEGLRRVEGDGVFLLTSVGGYVNAEGDEVPSWWTPTLALAGGKVRPEYESALASGALVYHAVPWVFEGRLAGVRLGITPQFARDAGWSFPPNSLVFLNGPGQALPQWLSVLELAGAGLILGWHGSAHVRTCIGAAQDLFELCFGTNVFDGTHDELGRDPPYRGLGIGAALDYLDSNGYLNRAGIDGEGASFQYFPGHGGLVTQLRPTISYLTLKAADGVLELVGEFGTESGKVQIGPSLRTPSEHELATMADPALQSFEDLSIDEWRSDFIRARIPDQKAGLVQVRVGPLYSNAVPLTRWRLKFQLERTVGGELHRSASVEVVVREQGTGYRLDYGQDEFEQRRLLILVNDLQFTAGYTSSGSLSKTEGDTTTTEFWSGSGNFGRTEGTSLLSFSGELDLKSRTLKGMLVLVAGGGLHVRRESTRLGVTTVLANEDTTFQLATVPGATGFAFTANLDEHLGVPAGATSWDEAEVVLGSSQVARNTLTWGFAAAEFPPERDRYGR